MRLSRRETVLLGILLVVGGYYVFYNFYYYPGKVDIDRIKEENTRLNREIESLTAKEGGLADISQEKRRLNDELDQMQVKLPQSPLLADIIAFLEKSARDSQVKLISLNYKDNPVSKSTDSRDANQVKPVQATNVQVTASGNYSGLQSFLTEIENSSRIYVINSGKISLMKRKTSTIEYENGSETGVLDRERETTVIEKESLTYDRNNLVFILDISAFYDRASVGK